jgi:hypothetical protein
MQYRLAGLVCAALFAVCACATLAPEETGQKMIGGPESAVRDTFGKPDEIYRLTDGTTRWIYSGQPLGFFVYAADFDAAGTLRNFRQMLTEKEIYTAQIGVWTKRDIEERFGRTRDPIQYYPLMKREAWSYRLYKDGNLPAHFSCYFDDKGVLQQTMIIVDPLGGSSHGRGR